MSDEAIPIEPIAFLVFAFVMLPDGPAPRYVHGKNERGRLTCLY